MSKKWSLEEAAERFGYSKGGYLKLERGERKLTLSIIERASEIFGVSDSDIYTDDVPLVGYVGAGAEMHFHAAADNLNEYVPMPPGGGESTVAVQIRGSSLGSIFDTWLVYYDEVRDPPSTDMLGKLCVVGLEDDRVLVKKLRKGSIPGHFNLESTTEALIEDARVLWAAKVRVMTPR